MSALLIAEAMRVSDLARNEGVTLPTMTQIVGRMAAIGGNPRPLKMDPYRHDDCQPQFQAALAAGFGADDDARLLSLLQQQFDAGAAQPAGGGSVSPGAPA